MIRYPVSTEKAIKQLELDNKLVFIVDRKDTKPEIKKMIEELFSVKIETIRTNIGRDGKKRAIVRLSPETPALDIATNLGLL